MRESMGGAWLFGIVIVFIFFFAAFLAYSVSYTKAFNVKNKIIDIIEQNEGYTIFAGDDLAQASNEDLDKTTEGKVYKYIRTVGYNYSTAEKVKCADPNGAREGGYCLIKYCTGGNHNTHYKVTSYIALELPIINIVVNIPISGETRTIYFDTGNYNCSSLESED